MFKFPVAISFISVLSIAFTEFSLACTPGSKKTVDMAPIRVTAPGTSSSNRIFRASATSLPQEGWAITNFDYTYDGKLDEINYKWTGSGGQYASSTQIRDYYKNLIDAAGKAGAYQAQAKYKQEMESSLAIANSIQSDRASIEVTVGVRAGSGLDFRDKTLVFYPRLTMSCIGSGRQIAQYVEQQLNFVSDPNIPRYAAICIGNRTSNKINFSYRWGNRQWQEMSIEPGNKKWFSWAYDPGSNSSPNFEIKFDSSYEPGYQEKSYDLKRYAVREQGCNGARQYYFNMRDSKTMDLFSQGN